MNELMGFQVGFWDCAPFAAMFVIVVAGLSAAKRNERQRAKDPASPHLCAGHPNGTPR
jgi:hypothetical protein